MVFYMANQRVEAMQAALLRNYMAQSFINSLGERIRGKILDFIESEMQELDNIEVSKKDLVGDGRLFYTAKACQVVT